MTARISTFITVFLSLCLCAVAAKSPQKGVKNIEKNPNSQMEPKLTTRKEIKLIGIAVRTTNQQEMIAATAKIPGLWGRFFQEQVADKIADKTALDSTLAAYTNYESDHTGAYDLIVGREVNSLGSIPDGMTGVTIPAGKYLLFTAKGPMPRALIDTWAYIWNYFSKNSGYRRSYTTDYEVHQADDKVDIYIAIK